MFNHPVVIISGASRGLGAATARWLAKTGSAVTLISRSADALKGVAEEVQRLGGTALAFKADVSDPGACQKAVATTLDRFGRLDALVNNAGIVEPIAAVVRSDPDRWQYNIAVNLLGPFYLAHAAIPELRNQNGRIINVSSGAATTAIENASAYCAAKAAVIQLTKCVAMELAPFGVRVNSISPGAIATPIFAKAFGLNSTDADRSVEALISYFKERLPLQRSGLPDDIAYGALYLASEEGSFVTGHNLVIDTGITAGRTVQEQAIMNEKLAEVILGVSGE